MKLNLHDHLLLGLLCALFFLTSCNQEKAQKETLHKTHNTLPTSEIGAFLIGISFDPNPPHRGKNKIEVMIMSKKGFTPIRPNKIEMTAVMSAMGTMSEMQSHAKMAWQPEKKSSLGELLIGMDGTWTLTVHFVPADHQPAHQSRFKLLTKSPDLVFLGGEIGGVQTNLPSTSEVSTVGEDKTGTVVISPERQQWIGVTTDFVEIRPLTKKIRTTGRVTYNERKRAEISLKFSGFVGDVFADFVGKPIVKGTTLFTIYSPDLSAAIGEYISLLSASKTESSPQPLRWDAMTKTARQKLLLWNITKEQLDQIIQNDKPDLESPQYFPIRAPVSGVVVEKQIVRGSPITAGQILYRLADLSTVWIESAIFESEMPLMRVGLPVSVKPTGLPNTVIEGAVSFIAPLLNPESRAGAVRIEVPNRQGKLLPEMSVTAEINIALGERLSVPKEAVIHTGDKTMVFVALSEGRFSPRWVTIGQKGDPYYEVLSGLSKGEKVVTNGNFLIASAWRGGTGRQRD
ncbi:MAG: efflux RND transporter periplasmic adaptor subunit [Nitrospirota bacterium]